MPRYVYKRVMFDIMVLEEPSFEVKLNELGAEGWELISTFDRERGGNSKECYFLFKKTLE